MNGALSANGDEVISGRRVPDSLEMLSEAAAATERNNLHGRTPESDLETQRSPNLTSKRGDVEVPVAPPNICSVDETTFENELSEFLDHRMMDLWMPAENDIGWSGF